MAATASERRTAHLGGLRDHLVDEGPVGGCQAVQLGRVHLVGHHQQRLVGEEGLDAVEERGLLRQGVPALLADVQDVQHRRAQVRQRCDALRRGWPKSED